MTPQTELAVQKAIYTALTGSIDVTLLVRGVYDAEPRDGTDTLQFPYITIGEDSHSDWSTDTESGDSASITVHTWSRYTGRAEERAIQAAVYNALHRQPLTVEGFALVACDWIGTESTTTADGETRHGIQTFRLLIEQAWAF